MAKLMLFNREEEYLGDIDELQSANHTLELNGEDSLSFETLNNNVEKGYRILLHDREIDKFYEFIVQEKDEYKSDDVVVHDIYAENSIVEMMGDFIEDKRSLDVEASHAVSRALEPTRWSLDHIDKTDKGSATFYRTNARAAIDKIVEEWLLELETVIKWDPNTKKIDRSIRLVKERGQFRGTRLTYTRDIVDIKRKTLPGNVITALYGFGKGEEVGDGYGRRIDFSEINNGRAYVSDEQAKESWGRLDNDGNKVHSFGTEIFDNITDKERLLERTKGQLSKLSKPRVSYEARILDFFRLTNAKQDYIELGDTVMVLDRDFNPAIDYRTRILKIERNLLDVEESVITLGGLVRNIADREDEKEQELEEMKERDNLPNYEDDDGDWDDPGELPVYERASDMVKKYPTLKVGLSSWVDINEPDRVSATIGGKVTEVRDAISGEPIYRQNNTDWSPKLRNMGGRRWLSFTHSPMVLNEASGDSVVDVGYTLGPQPGIASVSEPIGDYPVKQSGTFINHIKNNDEIFTAVVIYYDRTDNKLGDTSQEGWSDDSGLDNIFPVGTSSPLGYPKTSHPPSYHYKNYSRHYGKDGIFPKVASTYIYDFKTRIRDEFVYSVLNFDLYSDKSFNNLGMGKENYNDYIFRYVQRYGGSQWRKHKFYQQNAFFEGEVSEIILFNRKLDVDELSILREYIEDKYGAMEIK